MNCNYVSSLRPWLSASEESNTIMAKQCVRTFSDMNSEWDEIMAYYRALLLKRLVIWKVLRQKLFTEPWIIQDIAPWFNK
jgi:hypothetical protein